MADPIHVLFVDDDPTVLERATAACSRQAGTFEVSTVESVAAVLERLSDGTVDCVVAGYDLPVATGVELLEEVRSRWPDLPFVLVTTRRSERIAAEAKAAGATDYLELAGGDEQFDLLAARVETAVVKRRSKRTRRADKLKLEQYRTLVSTVSDPMFMTDAEGRCTMVNQAMVEYTGSDREWLVGQHVRDLVGEAVFERGAQKLWEIVHGAVDREEAHLEVTFEKGDGRTRIAEASVTPIVDEGQIRGVAGVVRDISERKERELELGQYETIIETVPVGILVLDEEARIQWANEQFVRHFPVDLEATFDVSFTTFIELGYFDDGIVERYTGIVRHLLSSDNDDEKCVHELTVTTATGEERTYEAHTALHPLEAGEFHGTINVFRDITRRTTYQRELEHQNDRLERFTSLVSHDLRNPLNVAEGYLDLHADACGDPDDALDRVADAHGRMGELIDDLLSLARTGGTVEERDRVDLRRVARDAWEGVDTAEATLELAVDGAISAHDGRVRELFENLFRNAVEHGGDDVVVTVGRLDADETVEEADADRSDVMGGRDGPARAGAGRDVGGFYVADDGDGLPEDVPASDLLALGYTTADDGTGLGLGIVSQIAESHGWTVGLDEGPAGGARFRFEGVTLVDDEAS